MGRGAVSIPLLNSDKRPGGTAKDTLTESSRPVMLPHRPHWKKRDVSSIHLNVLSKIHGLNLARFSILTRAGWEDSLLGLDNSWWASVRYLTDDFLRRHIQPVHRFHSYIRNATVSAGHARTSVASARSHETIPIQTSPARQ